MKFRTVNKHKPTKVERRVMKALGRPIWVWLSAGMVGVNFLIALLTPPTKAEELVLLVLASVWVPAAIVAERAYRSLLNTCIDMQNLNREMLDHIKQQDSLIDYRDNVIHLFRVQAGMAPDQRLS